MRVLTLVVDREAAVLTPALVELAREAAGGGALRWLAEGEAAAIDLAGAPNFDRVRAALGGAPVDVLMTPKGLRPATLVADMDGTIVDGETLDMLAEAAGAGAAVAAITARSMAGDTPFAEALRARVAMLRGLKASAIEGVIGRVRLHPGARTLVATLEAHGAHTVLATGGFAPIAAVVAEQCGFAAFHANALVVADGRLTGAVAEPVLDAAGKLAVMRAAPGPALAVGDGANDLPMLGAAALAFGFRPKPVVAAMVRNRIEHAGLEAILFALGYARAAFVG